MAVIVLTLTAALGVALVMAAGWIWQRAAANAGWVDIFWTFGTGAACAFAALVPLDGSSAPSARQWLVAAMVGLWSLRLGGYITARVVRAPEDARYAELRREWGAAFQRRLLGFMLVQAAASAPLALAILLAARNPAPGIDWRDGLGVAILVAAVAGEGLADEQLRRFKADRSAGSPVCDRGLWGWSRHPNYFFEWLVWLAYPAIALRPSDPWSLAALIAPAAMFVLLRFGSGVPPLEKAMLASRGEAFRRYQARVSAFFPRPPVRSIDP